MERKNGKSLVCSEPASRGTNCQFARAQCVLRQESVDRHQTPTAQGAMGEDTVPVQRAVRTPLHPPSATHRLQGVCNGQHFLRRKGREHGDAPQEGLVHLTLVVGCVRGEGEGGLSRMGIAARHANAHPLDSSGSSPASLPTFRLVVPIITCLKVMRSRAHARTVALVASTVAARGASYSRASSPNPIPFRACTPGRGAERVPYISELRDAG